MHLPCSQTCYIFVDNSNVGLTMDADICGKFLALDGLLLPHKTKLIKYTL
ncbi:hypothetical protein I3760_14G027400 [Carya illinoinensis]|nr:hypothetical protein I3760_14G027400 [Carya illinoinensis]